MTSTHTFSTTESNFTLCFTHSFLPPPNTWQPLISLSSQPCFKDVTDMESYSIQTCLTSFYLVICIYISSTSFDVWVAHLYLVLIISHCLDVPQFIRWPTEGQVGCFTVLAIMNTAAISIYMHVFVWTISFHLLWGKYQGVYLLACMLRVFSSITNHEINFQSRSPILQSNQQWMKVPTVQHPDQHLLSMFWIWVILIDV